MIFALCLWLQFASAQPQMGIVGDSGSTGVATNPRLSTELTSLLGLGYKSFLELDVPDELPSYASFTSPEEFNLTNPIKPLRRVFYSEQEVKDGSKFDLYQHSLVARKVDIEEYSWGYLVGRKLKFEPQDIVMASEDGKRIETISAQFGRLSEVSPDFLPSVIFVSYSANDICHEDNLTKPLDQLKSEYAQSLVKQFDQIEQQYKFDPNNGTTIYLLAPLPFTQILTSPSINQKQIPFHGGRVTCGDLREDRVHRKVFGKDLADALKGECPLILKTKPSDQARIEKLRSIYQTLLDAQVEALRTIAPTNGFKFEYIPEISSIEMDADDVVNDCFHPSLSGHTKIARSILKHIGH